MGWSAGISPAWLSFPPLVLIDPTPTASPLPMCRTPTSEAGRGMPFWTRLRAYHGSEDRTDLSQRAANWSQLAVAALDSYR
jgi:hypothetical protein